MAQGSRIEWTQATWNPVTGCTKVSEGCRHCYAEAFARRLRAMGVARYRNGFRVTVHPDLLDVPLGWKKPRMIFVNSMSDLFHEDVPLEFIKGVFSTMEKAHWHTFQVLTKRAGHLAELAQELPWPENVWMGVSVEDETTLWRIDELRTVPASVRFVSFEPLLGPVTPVDLDGIHWVIAGGESGPRARPMDPAWVRALLHECQTQEVPFFFKQWGGRNKKKAGRLLDGRTWDGYPMVGATPS